MRYEVQITGASGIAQRFAVPARQADKLARVTSGNTDVVEADVLRDGVFLTAYVNGVRCFG